MAEVPIAHRPLSAARAARSLRSARPAVKQARDSSSWWDASIPRVVISIGGGWLRAWERERGLLAEVPMMVLWDDHTNEVRSWGREAQQMDGKTSPDQRVLRPWWNGEIVDRTVLRGLLEQFWWQVSTHFSWWQQLAVALRVRVVIDPTISPLHRRWLLATVREVGLWGVRPVDALQAVAQGAAARSLSGVLDIGFSGVRAAVYSPTGQLLAAAHDSSGSLFWTAHQIVETVRDQHELDIAAVRFYEQQWWVQHAGFDRTRQKAVVQPIPKGAVKYGHQAAARAVIDVLQQTWKQLTVEQRTHLAESGWRVVGGGAFPELLHQVQAGIEMPLRVEKQDRYAELVAVA